MIHGLKPKTNDTQRKSKNTCTLHTTPGNLATSVCPGKISQDVNENKSMDFQ